MRTFCLVIALTWGACVLADYQNMPQDTVNSYDINNFAESRQFEDTYGAPAADTISTSWDTSSSGGTFSAPTVSGSSTSGSTFSGNFF